MPPLKIKAIHHVALVTRDLPKAIAFYRDLLGFAEIPRVKFDFGGAWLFNYGLQIHLIENKDWVAPEVIRSRHNHFAFEVPDIEATEAQLRAAGLTLRINIQPSSNVKQVFCQDPDGHTIEFGAYGPTKTAGEW
ncbi:MAG: VOC family protein [Planctomycetes bacterium]|nr:VOC family protein [Planctomycetota bacterium]